MSDARETLLNQLAIMRALARMIELYKPRVEEGYVTDLRRRILATEQVTPKSLPGLRRKVYDD